MSFTLFENARRALALDSLAGLSVGDALGAQYFVPGNTVRDLLDARLPAGPWPWTDDTEEACCLVACLREGDFDRDRFAELLAATFDPYRGYGPGAVVMLRQIREGLPWPVAAAAAFDGQGSAGNGAAMRAAPLGAWHADSLAHAAAQGARAAEVTHAHPEGIAGGVAVAVAAAVAAAARLDGQPPDLLGAVLAHTPPGQVYDGLARARSLAGGAAGGEEQSAGGETKQFRFAGAGRSVERAAHELGNGTRSLAADTVPLAVWVAARYLDDFPAAVAACVSAGGDVDTTAAIAGGIVAAYTGIDGIPPSWLSTREPLPDWVSQNA